MDFVFVRYLALVKIRIEVLYELCENGRGDGSRSEDGGCFVCVKFHKVAMF